MKATIDLPDELYRRVKARTAVEGRRIREVAAELFRQWLDEDQASGGASTKGIPVVKPAQLHRHADAASLRRAYPRGYRLTGPLLPASKNAPVIPAAVVEQALEDMETEELTAHDRPG
jgi:hypothetical protein